MRVDEVRLVFGCLVLLAGVTFLTIVRYASVPGAPFPCLSCGFWIESCFGCVPAGCIVGVSTGIRFILKCVASIYVVVVVIALVCVVCLVSAVIFVA